MKLRNSKLYWQINEQIRAPKVRVIGADGKQLGIMAIGKALETAKKEGREIPQPRGKEFLKAIFDTK